MTKFKKRLIKIGIIALMPILALLLCLNNIYAYYEDSNGNLISDNLADLSTLKSTNIVAQNAYNFEVNNQILTITQTSATNDPYIYFKDFIYLSSGSYSIYYLSDDNQIQSVSLCQNNTSNILYNLPYENYTRITLNQDTYFGFGFEGNGSVGRIFNLKIMIYTENEQIDYEPFGIWYTEESYETQKYLASLTNINLMFNGAIVTAVNGSTNEEVTATLNLTNIQSPSLTFDMLPSSIISVVNNSSGADVEIWIKLKTPSIASFNFSSSYNDFGVSISSTNLVNNPNTPLSSDNFIWFNRNHNEYSYLVNPNFSYQQIDIYYFGVSHYDFTISLSSDNYFYRDGYNDGYIQGQDNGYSNGYNVGVTEGYNEGYNEGANSNLETNGMKTLFNSILSYPVNMIRSVFDFNFMGINVASIIMFVVSIGIVFFVIKKFKE